MPQLKKYITIIIAATFLFSCAEHRATPGTQTVSVEPVIDTSKVKAAVTGVINSVATGKPGTDKLKAAGSAVLQTSAAVLSDSGISSLGDSTEPGVKAAQDAVKKMSNAIGITPAALDSMKKAAVKLGDGIHP